MPENKNPKSNNEETEKKSEQKYEVPDEVISETKHSVLIDGKEIKYTATAGTLLLKEEVREEEGDIEKPKAVIFFIAYSMDDVEDLSKRPLTFSFNGGPGSSSVWLHLGLLGPRRVFLDDEGYAPSPPYHLIDNEYSLLDKTDLVFIDPVSTGYSRAVPGEKPEQFHDFTKDIESVGEFIRLYTTRYKRWSSPKFIIGESYGTTRAAGLADHLLERHGLFLNGLMLVSSILNFQDARFDVGNDLPHILFLPTYTATAWYHGRLTQELQKDLIHTLAEVEAFAFGDYTLALMKGAELPENERGVIIDKLAHYTGLSRDYIAQTNLRIEIHRFIKELLRDERSMVGRLDSRFKGMDRDAAGEKPEFDPSYINIQGPYTACLNDYVRRELGYESDLPYEILTGRVMPWNYDKYQNQYVNVAEMLRSAMTKNPSMKVFVANGYFDLATPYFATRYTFNHLGLEDALQANISMDYYESGHMMYIHGPSLAKQKADLTQFIQSALSG
ncbi:MAG: peptidase S10 [Anaerolineae bacterium SM23_ 63]|nr:MAG: peptidase S10 [Anaerolineae bacterium SM23_ 63]HEY46224.1 peptidase S10 [Anaerolineae bacterium]